MIVGTHPPCFEEINEAVESLTTRQVVFGAAQNPSLVPPGATIYNLDLVGHHLSSHHFPDFPIWDFAERNMALWKKAGRTDVLHVPVGYHPSMRRFSRKPPGQRDVDVAFFGSLNVRRRFILNQLEKYGYRMVVRYGGTRAQRDHVLSRTRIALNMLFYEDGVFPILRASHLFSNGVCTVNEVAPEALEGITTHSYSELVEVIRNALRLSDQELDHFASEQLQAFQKQPLVLP
jgi:hypothetical protein